MNSIHEKSVEIKYLLCSSRPPRPKNTQSQPCLDAAIESWKGELCVVPKGVEHKPYAENECKIMLVEPRGVVNTGDAESEFTASNDVWV